ncbi:MAG: undecaprenyl/decaprenyl-phosphate alpha-N-acetylglucosaminyl 1-phosphate transferase [Deltaproteobacteria bacterium]|nr:undecaprenyl/decaprenyl-phosphate alpha-N-acetylglucosaminyl 1-phosphate transferase [Deltaproteobacteria bacterium]
MTRYAFFTHILFAVCLFLISIAVCRFMINRVKIMDVPNRRSSHDFPVPKSGGIVIVITFLIGVLAIWFFGDATMIKKKYFYGFLFSAVLVAAISLYDDLTARPFIVKLASHVIAATVAITFGVVIHSISLPWTGTIQLGIAGYIITFLWIVGLTNAYNFMDGLNGMAAGQAVITSLFFCFISFNQGSTFVYIICYTIISGSLGFLVFNFPKPSLFMGDVGSAHTSLFVIPLLMFNYIYDTLFTFTRRLINKENVFAAHRSHLYQLFNRLGHSHVTVSCFQFCVCITQGIGAVIMINIQGNQRVFIFLPFLLFQVCYSVLITAKAKKAALI